jgi:uncharacterized protein HemX
MADPARPGGTGEDEATAILRRLEPALTRVEERVQAVETEQRRQGEALAELRGQVNQMSTQMPSIWTIAGLFAAINAVTVGVGFGLASALLA